MQEWILRRTCQLLVEAIVDPLLLNTQRQYCLDQLYKPLLALKRFYRSQHAMHKYWRYAQQIKRECELLFPQF
ncbi:hypothetical protein PALB_2410 [Pseudoalteromonas luteoviolacea B = ATCC 29581]|nr:hypothetical protein PALB_2410 [Pseudoalteromonas luteoviolacea B = ATCC 29581]